MFISTGFKNNRSKYNKQLENLNSAFNKILKAKILAKENEYIAAGKIKKGVDLPAFELDAIIVQLQSLIPGLKTSFSNNPGEQLQINKSEKIVGQGNNSVTLFNKTII